MEIERKFLVDFFDPVDTIGVEIDQGYLTTDVPEVRVRRKGDRAFITVKGDGSIARAEAEVEISMKAFTDFWPFCVARLCKTRYNIGRWEVDVYPSGLIVAEIELDNEREPLPPCPPALRLGCEVTEDPAYKNKHLARSLSGG